MAWGLVPALVLGIRWMLRALDLPAVAHQVGHRLGRRPVGVSQVPAVGAGGITIDAPEIAENGNAVPVSVSAPGAVAIMLLGAGNPEPVIARVAFGPGAGGQSFATRVRLARTQDVVALARLADGSVIEARAAVKVTIGGCGG